MAARGLDVIVVGAGPNGLAAAIHLARQGRTVRVYEAAEQVGGGTRSAELTLPGFVHDVCSTVQPLSLGSPFLRSLDLGRHGLEWVHAPLPLAHALTPARSVALPRDLWSGAPNADAAGGDAAGGDAAAPGDSTRSEPGASGDLPGDRPADLPATLDQALGRDAVAWRRLFGPLARDWERLMPMVLRPVLRPPRHPILLARFGLPAVLPATTLARRAFGDPATQALFGGMAGHSMLRLDQPLSASFAIVLGTLAHAVGWPIARGGSRAIASALETEATGLGVELVTGCPVRSLAELPPARAVILDLTPRQVLRIAGDRLPGGYRRRLERFRYGPGAFKIDWALDGPIPWTDPSTARALTVHIGGSIDDVAASEAEVARGRHAERPFTILVQPTIADPSRAPEGRHVAWAYCHVPNGSTIDMTAAIEAQVERYAPGFRDRVMARSTKDTAAMEAWDANYVGGDINGGSADWRQLLFRPVPRWDPYTTPDPSLFLGSSSTPPGGGVHGMSGWFAAREAERWLRRR